MCAIRALKVPGALRADRAPRGFQLHEEVPFPWSSKRDPLLELLELRFVSPSSETSRSFQTFQSSQSSITSHPAFPDVLRDDSDELKVMMAHADVIKSDLSWLPKPWLLKGEAANEYWHCIFDWWMECEEKKHAGIPIPPELEMSPEIEAMIEEDEQFWNYKDDIRPDEEGELPRWKYLHPRTWELFNWLLWGKPRSFQEIQVLMAQLMEPDNDEIQVLGEAQVEIIQDEETIHQEMMSKAP